MLLQNPLVFLSNFKAFVSFWHGFRDAITPRRDT